MSACGMLRHEGLELRTQRRVIDVDEVDVLRQDLCRDPCEVDSSSMPISANDLAIHDATDLHPALPALSIVVAWSFAASHAQHALVKANVPHPIDVELVNGAEKVAPGGAHNASHQPRHRHPCKPIRLRTGTEATPGRGHQIDLRREAHHESKE